MSGNNANNAAIVVAAQRAAAAKLTAQNTQILDAETAKREAQRTHPFNNQHVVATVAPHINRPMGEAIKQNVFGATNNMPEPVQTRKYIV